MEYDRKINSLFIAVMMIFFLSGMTSAKVISVPDDYGDAVSAVEAAEDGDTIQISEEAIPAGNIRELDSQGKALRIDLSSAASLEANCQKLYDFEDFAEDEIITNQIPGVTFEVIGNSDVDLHIEKDGWYGNDFSSKVLLIDTHPQDFSPDHFQMVFDTPQYEVSFNLGPESGIYAIWVFNAVSGGTRLFYREVTIPGGVFTGTDGFVQFTRSTGDIRRIVVEAGFDKFEAIDNLTFGYDPTPPEVLIDLPVHGACVDGDVRVEGIACDPDGTHKLDRLEYRRVHPQPDDDWTLIRGYVGQPVCTSGLLYTWDTTAPEIIDGVYLLRVTAENDCGLITTKEISVNVDNEFNTVDFQAPASGSIVGGDICFEGTVWDRYCFERYTVNFRESGELFWSPVNTDTTTPYNYDETKTNEPFAQWDYPASLPDGNYEVRVTGITTTGKTDSNTHKLILDNTPPTAVIDSPESCTAQGEEITIKGTARDTNLNEWRLDYWNPKSGAWIPIIRSNVSVEKDVLAVWNRGPGDGCPDVVRLRVTDNSRVNPCSTSTFGNDRHLTETFLILPEEGGACQADFDGDGDIDAQDLSEFAESFGGYCP